MSEDKEVTDEEIDTQPENDDAGQPPEQPAQEAAAQETPVADEQADAQEQTSDSFTPALPPVNTLLAKYEHKWFKIEQKVKARTESSAEDELYETHVRDYESDLLYLDIPKINGSFIVPPLKTKILANFIPNNSVYFFTSTLISITRLRGVPVWVLEMPKDFERIQRRHFLRMDILLPAKVRIETTDGVFLPEFKTNCLDISAGGIRYVLDYPLPVGKLAKVSFDDFPGVGSLDVLCKTVRAVKSMYSDDYWIGAQFIDLPYKTEDKIVSHIFKIQKRVIVSSSAE